MSARLLPQLFERARARTRRLFALARPEAYYLRPIPLRHPIVFYDGHLCAFAGNMLLSGQPSADPALDRLFARGIDPEDEAQAEREQTGRPCWPGPAAIARYQEAVQARLQQALAACARGERDPRPFYLVLEHELMHQETLLYMLHQLPNELKTAPPGCAERADPRPAPAPFAIDVPAGVAVLGAERGALDFGWDNEFPTTEVQVRAFAIDAYDVTNEQYLRYLQASGAAPPHLWRQRDGRWYYRGLLAEVPLPPSWPVYVTHAEALAYARHAGRDLPTEAEWHRAAFGDRHEKPYPWGAEPPAPAHGNFDFARLHPTAVGSFPAGRSALGVHDLLGNGWEWTATEFAPFPGFAADPAYPGYSADFFDGKHFVLKGGSPVTDRRLLRRSFRNWFYGRYPYMYATFRCVSR